LSLNPLKALDARSKAILPIWLGVTVILGVAFFLPRAFARIGIGGGLIGEILMAGVLVMEMGAVGFGALFDVIGRTKVLLIGVVGLSGLLASVGISSSGGFAGLTRSLPVIGVFAIATSAIVPTILATVGDRAAQRGRGSAMGLYSMMLSGGTAIGTLAAGVAHRASGLTGILEVASFVFAVACLVSLILWIRIPKAEPGKSA
jgi:MFS family permease